MNPIRMKWQKRFVRQLPQASPPFGVFHNHFDPQWIYKFPDKPLVLNLAITGGESAARKPSQIRVLSLSIKTYHNRHGLMNEIIAEPYRPLGWVRPDPALRPRKNHETATTEFVDGDPLLLAVARPVFGQQRYSPPESLRKTYSFNPDWKFIRQDVPVLKPSHLTIPPGRPSAHRIPLTMSICFARSSAIAAVIAAPTKG